MTNQNPDMGMGQQPSQEMPTKVPGQRNRTHKVNQTKLTQWEIFKG